MAMGFLSQLRYRVQNWMYGRNGVDILSRDLDILALVLMISGSIFRIPVIYWLGFICFGVALFRIISRNRVSRSAENMGYLVLRNRVRDWYWVTKQHLADRKYYKFYRCASCKRKLRLPKGKGKIEITCPQCGLKFIKKT